MSTSVMEVILLNQESFQKENASGDESKTPGDGLWKGSSRPYSTPGKHSEAGPEQTGAINEVGELNFYYKEKSVRFNISGILRVAASSPTTKQKRLGGGGGG